MASMRLHPAVLLRTCLNKPWRSCAKVSERQVVDVTSFLGHVLRRSASTDVSINDLSNSTSNPAENSRAVRRRRRCDELLAKSDHWITSADHGRTVVFFHPEQPFPYEHTRPLPEVSESDLREADSVLKIQIRHAAVTDNTKMKRHEFYDDMKPMFYDNMKLMKPNYRRKKLEAAGVPSPHESSPREGV